MLSKRLEDIESDLERGIFLALYRSCEQHQRRRLGFAALALKHTLRGLLFLWPIVIAIVAVALFLKDTALTLYLLVLIPGLAIALHINIPS